MPIVIHFQRHTVLLFFIPLLLVLLHLLCIEQDRNPAMAFTSFNQDLDYEWVRYAYELTRKDGAVDVDVGTLSSGQPSGTCQ